MYWLLIILWWKINPIFGSSFNQKKGKLHYFKDARIAEKSQHARRFWPNRLNSKFQLIEDVLMKYAWDDLYSGWFGSSPSKAANCLNLLGKIHEVDVCTHTYTCASYIFSCFFSHGCWNCMAFKILKNTRNKSTIKVEIATLVAVNILLATELRKQQYSNRYHVEMFMFVCVSEHVVDKTPQVTTCKKVTSDP